MPAFTVPRPLSIPPSDRTLSCALLYSYPYAALNPIVFGPDADLLLSYVVLKKCLSLNTVVIECLSLYLGARGGLEVVWNFGM